MLINFNEIVEKNISQMNGGNGEISAKMYVDKHRKIISSLAQEKQFVMVKKKYFLLVSAIFVKKVQNIALSILEKKI